MSSDSESDFWVESPLEQKSIGITVFIPDDEPETLNKSKDEMEELFKQSPNDYYREHVQTVIDRLRAGAKQNLENEIGKELRKQQREHKKKIQELIVKQKNEMLEIKKDYDSLKFLLLEKDEEITNLQRIIIDQEFPINKQRIQKFVSKAKIVEDSLNKDNGTKELQLEINAYKLQLVGMKELVKMYQEQTEKAKNELKTCEELLKYTQNKAENDVKYLNEEIEKNSESFKKEIEELQGKYRIFKEEVKKELEISQIVIKQQVDINNALKKELRSAKAVLVTPRLREKFDIKIKADEPNFYENRLKPNKKLKKRDSTLDYLISTRASPAEIPSPDINLNSSLPLVGLLPEISSRHIN